MVKDTPLRQFIDELASSNPTPGGGAVAPINLCLAIALLEMVIQHSVNKKRFAEYKKELGQYLQDLGAIRNRIFPLVDEDSRLFLELMTTYKEKHTGKQLLDIKLKNASEPAQKVLNACKDVSDIARKLTHKTNKNLSSDIEVAVANILAAASGAMSNIFINIRSISDKETSQAILHENLEKKIFITELCEIILQETESPSD